MYEYHYWKCYYLHGSTHEKAAALYSTDVDYYTYGECRLAGDGAYYCGTLSSAQPWKGFASTSGALSTADDPAKLNGAPKQKYDSAHYAKLQQAANAKYYAAKVTTGENNPERHAYAMTHGNNGQEWELPTYTDAKGNQFQFTNGQFSREWMGPYMQAEAMNSLADNLNLPSNRAMKKPEQRLYNGGVHWVSG